MLIVFWNQTSSQVTKTTTVAKIYPTGSYTEEPDARLLGAANGPVNDVEFTVP